MARPAGSFLSRRQFVQGTAVAGGSLAAAQLTSTRTDASSPQEFGARGDGETDDTEAIRHALADGDGLLLLPRGDYRITETIEIPLNRLGRTGLAGDGGTARVLMEGPGPAFRFIGTHEGTSNPSSFAAGVLDTERMPTLRDLEILGRHNEADGVELTGTMQAIINGVALRNLRHGVHLVKRNRNVIISDCQIYHNRGVGIFLENLNLHQINIYGNHISFNRLGGIRIEGSEIRNLQIVGNDIEYNNDREHGLGDEPTAEIYVDVTSDGSSVDEVTVSGNTIQATPSVGGANIRILDDGKSGRRPGLWTITGNVIGNQTNNIHLTGCRGVTISGNSIYSCTERNLLVESSSRIVFTANHSYQHVPRVTCGWRLVDSSDCTISGCSIHDDSEEGQTTGASLLEIVGCERINVTGCQLIGGVPHGVDVVDSSMVSIGSTMSMDTREVKYMKSAIRFAGQGKGNLITGCTLGHGKDGTLEVAATSDVTVGQNVEV